MTTAATVLASAMSRFAANATADREGALGRARRARVGPSGDVDRGLGVAVRHVDRAT